MEPIRVLQVVTKMDAGGIETLLMNFYRNIDRSKVQFDFLVHRKEKGFYDEEILSLGGKIYSVPGINPLKHGRYLNALEQFFEKHKEYKLVHSHINTFSTYPLRAAMNAGVSIRIAHSHIAFPKYDYKAPFKIYAKSQLKKYCTHLFACSNWAGKWLYGSKNNDFMIIKNSVDTNKFIIDYKTRENKRNELLISDKFVLGHVGRFNTQKNHSFLLDIFKSVHDQNSNAMLILVGDGELRPIIEKRINDLKLNDSVILTGVRSDVSDLLQAMDVFVFPSLYEGLPVTLVEAQAAGLPCVVSDSVTDEVKITNLITYISLKESTEQWTEKILYYSKNFQRKNTYNEIVKAGYDIKYTANWLQEFYINEYNLY